MTRNFIVLIVFAAILSGCTSLHKTPLAPTMEEATRLPQLETEETGHSPSPSLTTPELIDAATARGTITSGERLLYLAYAVYEPDSLPEEYRSNLPWRGTLVVREIKEFAVSPDTFCTLAPYIQREIRRLIPESASCPP
jgi:hypothetical protein